MLIIIKMFEFKLGNCFCKRPLNRRGQRFFRGRVLDSVFEKLGPDGCNYLIDHTLFVGLWTRLSGEGLESIKGFPFLVPVK
jgi:hypothetical protein